MKCSRLKLRHVSCSLNEDELLRYLVWESQSIAARAAVVIAVSAAGEKLWFNAVSVSACQRNFNHLNFCHFIWHERIVDFTGSLME